MIIEYDCVVCGKHVRKRRSPGNLKVYPKYCSQKCHGIASRVPDRVQAPNTKFTCIVCGKEVETYRSPSSMSNYIPKYCSVACTGKGQMGKNNPAYSGGRHKLSTGYVVVLCPDHPRCDSRGYVLEHRFVMESVLCRYLDESEAVHHINGIIDDNRICNLCVFKTHSEHEMYHQALKELKNNERD
ncbi:HNH endonuclease [Candidatus Pacearchaeota archaeon]|jgi:predicted nucleic acid-binding Zn ribbon protein|nr:HNH endonuclease [Candidatus Pacearchaeota archaeon]